MIHSSDIERLAVDRKTKERNYWLKQLSGELVKTAFPMEDTTSARGKKINSNKAPIGIFNFNVPADTFSRLNTISKGSNPRLFVVLLAALVALLKKYTGHNDIIVGAPVVKQSVEAKFVNTVLALRTNLENITTFRELLQTVRQVLVDATANQNYPLNNLLYELNIPTMEKEFPLFDIALLMENIHDKSYLDHIMLNMLISFRSTGDTLEGFIEYNAAKYPPIVIERIFSHFVLLLQQVLSDPDTSLPGLDILSPAEKQQLLFEFNNLTVSYPGEKTLQELFRDQVTRNGDTVALHGDTLNPGDAAAETGGVGEPVNLTYGELDRKASGYAQVLRMKGIGDEVITALVMERTVEMIIGILAILKAGGAYLPISTRFPRQRIAYIIKDSQAPILLTHKHFSQQTDGLCDTIYLGDKGLLESCHEGGNPGPEPGNSNTGAHLAYVIYTSGTTRQPKGVNIEHHSVHNLVAGLKETIYKDYPQPLILCLLAPYEFDASVQQIFGALLQGHSLYIVPEETRLDGVGLLEFYTRHQVDISDGTPSHIRLLIEALEMEPKPLFLPVKHFIIAGETFSPKTARQFWDALLPPLPCLSNLYGPTETCVDSTFYHISPAKVHTFDSLPIGNPLPNQHVYILDKESRLLPRGVPGELCIGGHGVARGYLNQPELTADKFNLDSWANRDYHDKKFLEVSEPFFKKGMAPPTQEELGSIPGKDDRNKEKDCFFCTHLRSISKKVLTSRRQRLYKTGDLARWLADGNIEFLGRSDHQVKLRGYRIELGEIEHRLLTHDQIREAVVQINTDANDGQFLCAYYVTGTELPTGEIRDFLAKYLPGYMVPSYFVQLDKIPLTENGKLNRKALPAPTIPGEEYSPPKNALELKLTRVWAGVLNIEKTSIGIDQNFFQLGGHSLNAMALVSRIHKELKIKIPLVELFKTPTIRELASYIDHHTGRGRNTYTAIEPVEEKEYYPLSPAQKRLYILQQMDEENIAYNIPTMLMIEEEMSGFAKEPGKLDFIIRRLISRHESFRTSFPVINEQVVQRVFDQGEIDFPMEYLQPGDHIGDNSTMIEKMFRDFVRPFRLTRAPLLRIAWVEITATQFLLMVDIHHIISDGVSNELLIREFTALCREESLSPLRIRYKDFSEWQNGAEIRKSLHLQEKYWLEELPGKIPVLKLPTDYPRPAFQSFAGRHIAFELAGPENTGLKTLALEEGATLFMILLAITTIFLSKLTGVEDIIIGTPISGRNHPDLEQIIGMFVNTLALRNYPGRETTFVEFLNLLKERTLAAFENQDYPFDELVEKLNIKRDPGRNPLFDMMFAWQNDLGKERKQTLPGDGDYLETAAYSYEDTTSKFDLSLDAMEGDKLHFLLEYNAQLFKPESINQFILYFKEIVEAVVSNKYIKLSEITISHDFVDLEPILHEDRESEFGF